MALTLKDLLEAQSELKKKDEEAAGRPASMSMEQLKQLASSSSAPAGGGKADPSLVRIYQELRKQTVLLTEMRGKDGKKEGAPLTKEEKLEAGKIQDEQTKLLKQIAENTTPKQEKEEEKDQKKPDLLGILGAIGTGLAIALGTVAGLVSGYIKTLKFFAPVFRAAFEGFHKALVAISDFFPSFKRLLFRIEVTFELGLQMLKEGFTKFMTRAAKVFDDIIGGIKALFGAFKESKVFQFLMSAKDAVIKYFEPIAGAFKTMQETSGPIQRVVGFISSKISAVLEFFGMIGAKLGAFGKLFGAVASVVGKIAFPLMVIMTIWDTVKGAIEGFEKDGIVGAIAGAIKGFVNSLIMAPLDMLKSAVSWILGAFGFDKAEKFLDSFKFEDLFSGFIDAIFSPIETLKKLFAGAMKVVENIGIPEISFTIPIIDKKIAFGPYYPFKKDGSNQGARIEGGSEPGKVDAGGKPGAAAGPGGGGGQPAKSDDQKARDWAYSVHSGKATMDQVPAQYKDQAKALVAKPPSEWGGAAGAKPAGATPGAATPKQESKGGKAGPNWTARLKDYEKGSTPVDNYESMFPGIKKKFIELAKASTPRTDNMQSLESHEQLLVDKAKAAMQGGANKAAPAQKAEATTPSSAPSGAATPKQEGKGAPLNMDRRPAGTSEKVQKLKEEAQKQGLDPNAVIGRFEGGVLTEITDRKTGKTFPVEVSESDKRNVEAARTMRAMNERSAQLAAGKSPEAVGPSVQAPPPQAASAVYNQSEQNAAAAAQPPAPAQNNVVSAPTTNVNNTTNQVTRIPSRNNDSSLQDFYSKRYAF